MQPSVIKTTVIFVMLAIVTTAISGCGYQGSGEASAEDTRPFYTDRVVTVRLVMDEADWEFTQDNALSEQYVKADLWYDGELIPYVAVRPKGNSSLKQAVSQGSIRFGLKVDLNFFNSARNLYGVKKLNFSNGFSDPTLIREALAYELYRYLNIPTPRTSFVDLWVNDTRLGVYTMVEQIDTTFLSNYFADSNGNLYKPEVQVGHLNWTEADLAKSQEQAGEAATAEPNDTTDINLGGGNLSEIMRALELAESRNETGADSNNTAADQPRNQELDYLEIMGLKTNENNPDHTRLLHLLDILNNEPDETFPEEIEKVLDVDETLRFLAVSALIVHLDNYIAMGHNYYLYDNNGKFVILPWDLNMAFGTFNYGLDRDQLFNYYIDEPTGGPVAERPLVARLLAYQPYLDTYHGYLEELLDGPFSVDSMNARIDTLADLIRPYVVTDELKFFSNQQFEAAFTGDVVNTAPGAGPNSFGLKAFVRERGQSVREQLEGIRPASSGDGSGNRGSFGDRRNQQQQPQQPRRQPRNVVPGILNN